MTMTPLMFYMMLRRSKDPPIMACLRVLSVYAGQDYERRCNFIAHYFRRFATRIDAAYEFESQRLLVNTELSDAEKTLIAKGMSLVYKRYKSFAKEEHEHTE